MNMKSALVVVACFGACGYLLVSSGIKNTPTDQSPTSDNPIKRQLISVKEKTEDHALIREEVLPSANRNSANKTSAQDIKGRETMDLHEWMQSTGYDLYEAMFAAGDEQAMAIAPIADDYLTWDINMLRAAAAHGDTKAALYLGINLDDPAEAIPMLENALVGGDYLVASHQIAMHYDLLSHEVANQAPLYERLASDPTIDLLEHDKNYLKWLAVGIQLNDPMSLVIAEATNLSARISQSDIQQLSQKQLQQLESRRLQYSNLPSLAASNQRNSNTIQRFYKIYLQP